MMQSAIKKQQGAVLAFCLVMLLLLTLAGTRMIQQNKQQLEMANSARLLTQEFANAEGVLKAAETILENHPAHQDPTEPPVPGMYDENHQCTPIENTFKQQILVAGTELENEVNSGVLVKHSEIIEAFCANKVGEIVQKCSAYDYKQKIVTCFPLDKGEDGVDCTGKSIKDVAALFSATDNFCYQQYDPFWDDTDYFNAHGIYYITPPRCPIVVYKVRVISNSPNGTQRELVRGKQIICGTPSP